jgi:hypothetical protein
MPSFTTTKLSKTVERHARKRLLPATKDRRPRPDGALPPTHRKPRIIPASYSQATGLGSFAEPTSKKNLRVIHGPHFARAPSGDEGARTPNPRLAKPPGQTPKTALSLGVFATLPHLRTVAIACSCMQETSRVLGMPVTVLGNYPIWSWHTPLLLGNQREAAARASSACQPGLRPPGWPPRSRCAPS